MARTRPIHTALFFPSASRRRSRSRTHFGHTTRLTSCSKKKRCSITEGEHKPVVTPPISCAGQKLRHLFSAISAKPIVSPCSWWRTHVRLPSAIHSPLSPLLPSHTHTPPVFSPARVPTDFNPPLATCAICKHMMSCHVTKHSFILVQLNVTYVVVQGGRWMIFLVH